MRIAICDDVKLYNEQLRCMLSDYISSKPINHSITEYTCGQTLTDTYKQNQYDYIFLDVEMPNIDGFETAKRIRAIDKNVAIIFVTHMKSQMQQGYRYNAKDYLCKPVTQQHINELMDRLLEEQRQKDELGFYTVKLKFDEGTMRLNLADVLYFESSDRYVLATMAEEAFTFRGQLSEVENDLRDKGFVRIHRSYLVNTRHVFKCFGDSVVFKNGESVAVGRRYKGIIDKLAKIAW